MSICDPLDQPFLPDVGDLYWVKTTIFWSLDPKPTRPAVVIEVPVDFLGRVAVVTRTTEKDRKGVLHPAMPEIGLNKPGIFSDFRSVEATLWTPPNVKRVGALARDVLGKVMERFG